MGETAAGRFEREVGALDPGSSRFATEAVDAVLRLAREARASDVHLQPGPGGLAVSWRVDGVLQPVGTLPASLSPNVVARLKVLADLLTYRTDVPQEGRIRTTPGAPETRVSTFPTLHGERAVVRLFAAEGRHLRPADLGYPDEVREGLCELLGETGGMIVFAGPAGSGKTTSMYACLRELAAETAGRRCLVTLEDPIEVAVPGVSQSQVNGAAGLTLDSGLKSLLRQDPEVIGVGEIRDASTAGTAFQAALSGHLVLTTFHAGTAAEAIGRLSDMGIEPYILRSGLRAIVSQRLVRRLCGACSRPAVGDELMGLEVASARVPVGCEACGGTGYAGRLPLVEMLWPGRAGLSREVLRRADTAGLQREAEESGMVSIGERARRAVEQGETSPSEVRRVMGLKGGGS